MSNDTGIVVRLIKGRWAVRSKNASSGHESPISTHSSREEAIQRATEEAQYPTEYGIMHIDKSPSAPSHPPITKRTNLNESEK